MHDCVQMLTYVCDTGMEVQHLGVSALHHVGLKAHARVMVARAFAL